MAKLGWIGSVGLAVGASAGAAAAQFGLGYGLGIISWSPTLTDGQTTPDGVWLSSLAWTLWIAATSTVVGAIAADRRSAGEIGAAPPRTDPGMGGAKPAAMWATAIWRTLLAVSAAIGALLAVALVLVPARAAVRLDTSTPALIAAGYAVVGIVVGIVSAVCALAARAAATNFIVTASWLWLLAIGTVIDGVAVGRGLGTAPLGVWPFGDDTYFRHTYSLPGALLMLGGALIIGAAAAWRAATRGDNRTGSALSGGLGPLLVAVAYSLTAPGLVGIDDPQLSALLLSSYALIAGLVGSVLLVAARSGRSTGAAGQRSGSLGFGRRQRRTRGAATDSIPVRIPTATAPKSRDEPTGEPTRTGTSTGTATVPAPKPGPASGPVPGQSSKPARATDRPGDGTSSLQARDDADATVPISASTTTGAGSSSAPSATGRNSGSTSERKRRR